MIHVQLETNTVKQMNGTFGLVQKIYKSGKKQQLIKIFSQISLDISVQMRTHTNLKSH